MSAAIEVGARRIWNHNGRAVDVVEQLTENPFAGEFRYRYVDSGMGGILSAEELAAVTRPAPTNPSDGAVTPALVALDLAEAAADFGRTTDTLLALPADADPATLREAFAAARKALDEFEAASGITPSGEPITLTLDGATMVRHTTDPDLDDLYAAGWVNEWDDYGPECDGCDDDNEPHADGCRRLAQISGGAR